MNVPFTRIGLLAPAPAGASAVLSGEMVQGDSTFSGLLFDMIAMPAAPLVPTPIVEITEQSPDTSITDTVVAESHFEARGTVVVPTLSALLPTVAYPSLPVTESSGQIVEIEASLNAVEKIIPADVLEFSPVRTANPISPRSIATEVAELPLENDLILNPDGVWKPVTQPTTRPYSIDIHGEELVAPPLVNQKLHETLASVQTSTVTFINSETAGTATRVLPRFLPIQPVRQATFLNVAADAPRFGDPVSEATETKDRKSTVHASLNRVTGSTIDLPRQSAQSQEFSVEPRIGSHPTAISNEPVTSPRVDSDSSETPFAQQRQERIVSTNGESTHIVKDVNPVSTGHTSDTSIVQHSIKADTASVATDWALPEGETASSTRPARFSFDESPLTALRTPGKAIQISMHPEHVGRATLTVSLNNGQVTAKIVVASEEARALVEQSLDDLVVQLHRSQVTADQIVVSVAGEVRPDVNYDRHTRSGRWHKPQQGRMTGQINSPAPTAAWVSTQGIPILQSGSINLVA